MIIARLDEALRVVLVMGKSTAEQKRIMQEHRREYLLRCKAAGDQFILIRNLLSEATPSDPAETEYGLFKSWDDFKRNINKINSEFPSRPTIDKYVYLASRWDYVQNLDLLHLDHCYRLDCTVRILEWYEGKPDEERGYLTVDNYWTEHQTPAGPSKKELTQQLSLLAEEVEMLRQENEDLKAQLALLSKPKINNSFVEQTRARLERVKTASKIG